MINFGPDPITTNDTLYVFCNFFQSDLLLATIPVGDSLISTTIGKLYNDGQEGIESTQCVY